MDGNGAAVRYMSDLEQIVVKNDRGVPVLLRDVARIELTLASSRIQFSVHTGAH